MRTNAITKILANDKEYTKSALASLDLESFKAIDKAMEKLDYEDLGELADKSPSWPATRLEPSPSSAVPTKTTSSCRTF